MKAGTTVTWTNEDDIPHTVVSQNNFRSKVLDTDGNTVHLPDAGHLQIFLLAASAHDRNGRGGSADGKCCVGRTIKIV